MGGELSSDMPGTEEFEGMSEEEIGAELPEQGAPGSERSSEQRQSEQKPAAQSNRQGQAQAEKVAESAQLEPKASDSTKVLETKIEMLERTLQNMSRENRGYQALQSKVDRLENELKTRAAAPKIPLTPEQQKQAEADAQAENYLDAFLEKKGLISRAQLEKDYGHIIQAYERQENEQSQVAIKGSVEELCKQMDVPFEEMNSIFGKLINQDVEAAKNGDQAANARLDRLMKSKDPHELMFRAMSERNQALRATGAKVQVQQQRAAEKGGRSLKPGGVKPPEKVAKTQADLDAMDQQDLDRLSMDELEAAIPRQQRR